MPTLRDWLRAGADAALQQFGAKTGSLVKTAIGQRQRQRIDEALARVDRPDIYEHNLLPTPVRREGSPPSKRISGRAYAKYQESVKHHNAVAEAAADRLLMSGRHTDTPPVEVYKPRSIEDALAGPGIHPDRLAWRGTSPVAERPGFYGHPIRHFSALPSVAREYAQGLHSLTKSHINAYAIGDVPDANQGPWTPEIDIDPRVRKPVISGLGESRASAVPVYEKVIDATHVPVPVASYKQLTNPDRLQLVRGIDILRGASVEHLPVHHPTVDALKRSAPHIAARFLRGAKP